MKSCLTAASRTAALAATLIGSPLLAAAPAQSVAQQSPTSACVATVDPQNPAAPVPAVTYRSAFDGYRAFAIEKVSPWRETNDSVGRIGGWRVYARESQQGSQSAIEKTGSGSAQPDAAPAAKPAPHKH